MDFVEAYGIMKRGGTVFQKSKPEELYSAVFDARNKKYTIFVNGNVLGNDVDWESIFQCNEWEVYNDV